MYIKFCAFWKKYQLHSFNTFGANYSKKCGYLNAWKLLFQNTFHVSMCSQVPRLSKSPRLHFYPTFPVLWDKLSQKTSFLFRSKILGLFDNTLTVNHIYFRHNWGKFPQQVQMPLSQKKNILSDFFCIFEMYVKFCAFWKKGSLYSFTTMEVLDSKKCRCLNGSKLLFQSFLRKSSRSRIPSTDEICAAALVS